MYLEQAQLPATQQSQTLNISAKLIASIKVLQYSSEELEQAIATELSDNPALELEELASCPRCGSPMATGLCQSCDNAPADGADPRVDVAAWEDDHLSRAADLSTPAETDFDLLDLVHSGATLEEHLLRQLGAVLPRDDAPIAEYLVGSLNSHGYVACAVSEVSQALEVEEGRVEYVLSILQSLDPPGVGARDLSECLLLQLRQFEERGEAPAIARRLIGDYLNELGEHHFSEIARDIGATSTAVKQAWRFIRSNLNPYPAHAFEAADVPDRGVVDRDDRGLLVRPDVVIRRTDGGFEAEVVEQRRFRFDVNGLYSDLSRQARIPLANTRHSLTAPERQHVREFTSRARFFIDCVRQRWETLQLIADALTVEQHDFLEHGVRHLKPLTRGELAERVGLHESTVSRATAGKFVLLPSGRTIPFDDFFDGSLAAKDLLLELIASENRTKPYSDEDLAALLNERGLPLARRTVAKYREALGILPSRFRI